MKCIVAMQYWDFHHNFHFRDALSVLVDTAVRAPTLDVPKDRNSQADSPRSPRRTVDRYSVETSREQLEQLERNRMYEMELERLRRERYDSERTRTDSERTRTDSETSQYELEKERERRQLFEQARAMELPHYAKEARNEEPRYHTMDPLAAEQRARWVEMEKARMVADVHKQFLHQQSQDKTTSGERASPKDISSSTGTPRVEPQKMQQTAGKTTDPKHLGKICFIWFKIITCVVVCISYYNTLVEYM